MSISRRALLRTALALIALEMSPRFERGVGQILRIKEANAGYLAVAQLAISAVGAFVRQGDGMGAMLGNIKELQEETIRLVQQVLIDLGNIRAQLTLMPEIIKAQLFAHAEFRILEETQEIYDKLEMCERLNKRIRKSEKEKSELEVSLREIISKALSIARYRSVPYGIGGRAAICAPMVIAIDARARQLLGSGSQTRDAVQISYLPWIKAIQSIGIEGSLGKTLLDAGKRHQEYVRRIEEVMPPLLKEHLGKDFVLSALKLDPESPPINAEVACGQYSRIAGYRDGRCLVRDQGCRTGRLAVPEAYETQGLALESTRQTLATDPQCFECIKNEQVPILQPESTIKSIVTAKNSMMTPRAGMPVEELGPMLMVSTQWGPGNLPACKQYLVGTNTGEQQIVDLKNSESAKAWDNQFNQFVQGPLARINEERQGIYAMHQLLSTVRDTEALLAKVFA